SLDHPAAPAPLHRARGAARRHLRGQHVRPDLHPHTGRTGHGQYEPALLHLPASFPRLRHRPSRRHGRRRGHRHDRRRHARAPVAVPHVLRGAMMAALDTAVHTRQRGAGALTVLTWFVGLLFFFPVFWMVLTAFKHEADATTDPPKLFFTPTLEQFGNLFDAGAGPYFLNSLFATTVSTLLVIALAVPAAYALAIRPVKRTQDVLFFFISTKMLPVVAVIVPIYVIAGRIGALDNVWMLVVLYTAMNLPIAVWMMRSFLQEIPAEVLEAAQMDGATLR